MFVTSDERGWGYAHIWEMVVSMALYGDATTPRVFGVLKKPHSLLLLEKTEGEIKNGNFSDTGNIVHKTQNKDLQNKTKNTKPKTTHRKLKR